MIVPLLLLPPLVTLLVAAHLRGEKPPLGPTLVLWAFLVPGVLGGYYWASMKAIYDVEVWNGRIVGKTTGTQGCCHCRQVCEVCTDSNGRTHSCNCREECDHSSDRYWKLQVSTGDHLVVKQCASPSTPTPRVWDAARVGEPAAVPHTYLNYLLADRDSVYRLNEEEAEQWGLPPYPETYDLYKMRRVLGAPEISESWAKAVDNLNADLGKGKQVNVILVFTDSGSSEWARHLEAYWERGKKNDLIFVVGHRSGVARWAEVVSLSDVSGLRTMVRKDVPGAHLQDPGELLGVLRVLILEHFERTPMATYEYLWWHAKPTWWGFLQVFLGVCVASVLGSIFILQDGNRPYNHRNRY